MPKQGYTDLSLSWDTIERSNELNRVALDISVNIFRPLEKQYEQLESILLQKFSKSTVDTIMNLVKKKKERFDLFSSERLVLENTVIRINYPDYGVVILIYEKGAYLD